MSKDTYTFAVSEIMSGNRVLVTIYTRIGRDIYMSMMLYSDVTLREGKQLLDVHMLNGRGDE